MPQADCPVVVPHHPTRCTWCGELVSSTSIPVVAEGFVFHAVCYDRQEVDSCWDCGYPLVSPHPERTPSCRCHLAPLIYGDDAT